MNVYRLPVTIFLCLLLVGCAGNGPVVQELDSQQVDETLSVADESAVATDYILGQGDTISIQVFDEPDLTLTTIVGASGGINYSYLGDVRVSGKSPLQLERHIANLLQDGYLVNPSVNVTVVQYRPFYINGEVRSPGSYPYQPGLTLDKAIALAGGLTDRASTRKMFVIKSNDKSQDGFKVNLNFRLAPGDIVTIKEGFF